MLCAIDRVALHQQNTRELAVKVDPRDGAGVAGVREPLRVAVDVAPSGNAVKDSGVGKNRGIAEMENREKSQTPACGVRTEDSSAPEGNAVTDFEPVKQGFH